MTLLGVRGCFTWSHIVSQKEIVSQDWSLGVTIQVGTSTVCVPKQLLQSTKCGKISNVNEKSFFFIS